MLLSFLAEATSLLDKPIEDACENALPTIDSSSKTHCLIPDLYKTTYVSLEN